MVTLEEITVIQAPIERCFDLARSVEVHLAGNVHCGETAVALAGVTSGLVGIAQRVTWRDRRGRTELFEPVRGRRRGRTEFRRSIA